MAIRGRLRSILWRVPIAEEVRDELAHHLELRARAARPRARRAGMDAPLGTSGSCAASRGRRSQADAAGRAAQPRVRLARLAVGSRTINSQSHFVTPDYFRVLRIPMRAGRAFTDADVRSAPLVMIINERLAREAFGSEPPVGRRISCCEGGPGTPSWKTVVGVVGDVRGRGPATPPSRSFICPWRKSRTSRGRGSGAR
jgi:MacB-like periplasmic core domain